MNREKHFHPLAALHLLRKTLLVYLLPLVQVLFDRNWDALHAALRQDFVLLVFISAVCWAVYYGGRWQVDAEGTVHVSWRLGVRLDRALRAEGLAALMLEQPLLYRLTGACRVVLYPVGQTKTITLYLTRQQAEELADVLLPVTDPLWHAPKGGEKLAFTVLGANGLSTLILWWLAIHQTQSYAPDAQTAALAQLGQLAAFAARWLPLGTAWLLVLAGTLFCISLVRSALQAVHYTVWRTDTQLGSRGGLVRRYEMRLRLCQLNYADLRRSPATWALHYCPVFVSAGACRPELPLFVWREGTPLLRELLPEYGTLGREAAELSRMLEQGTKQEQRPEALAPLTEREWAVAQRMARRLSNREIAGQLFLTEGTVKQYINQIYSKLHLTGDVRTKRRRLEELMGE